MANTKPNKDSTFTEKPKSGKIINVPIKETGTVSNGIRVARQSCRKMKTTKITNITASNKVWTISLIPALMAAVVSSETSYFKFGGKRFPSSSMVAFTLSATSNALEPGNW
ncbi:hypothetical protein D3C80_412120 [compost metagenome]